MDMYSVDVTHTYRLYSSAELRDSLVSWLISNKMRYQSDFLKYSGLEDAVCYDIYAVIPQG